tara:strand:- start:1776 stop:2708 length:933 start_codon:yes stop_codon:yes gene_type:complete
MSFLINPYVFSGFTPIDFSGLSLTHLWSIFKTSEATITYCCRVTHQAGSGSYRYVFYDSNGEISLSGSQISTTTTPNESTTLQDHIDTIGGSPNLHVVGWYDQIGAVNLALPGGTSETQLPKLVASGVLVTKNSKTAIDFFTGLTNELEVGSGISQLDKGNDFSISSVASSSQLATQTILISSKDVSSAPNNRFELAIDTSTSKLISTLKEGGTANTAVYIAQENNTNQKRLVLTKDDNVEILGYLDDNLEDTTAIGTGVYTNDQFRVGANFAGNLKYEGEVQFIAIHNAVLTGANVTTLDGKLNDYFSF